MKRAPVILCILDGVGWGRRDEGDAVFLANTPNLDRLMQEHPWCLLQAHGTAVGLPSDEDMGNSEVGHNAMGAGRVFDQGAKLVDQAIASGSIWASTAWQEAMVRCRYGGTLHLLGLLSDGNVHSHVKHLHALLDRAAEEGVQRLRVHVLTDGRDVDARSALGWVIPLEARLQAAEGDWAIASGGGRMRITMDRYEADWPMVKRGWDAHVHARGRCFPSASEAIRTLYAEDPKVDDQWLPAFIVGDYDGMHDKDAVLLYNFRGDRAVEISAAFEGGPEFRRFDRGPVPALYFAGMMQYDGDLHIPRRYLVSPPEIDRTVGQYLAEAGRKVYAVSETQKFGHVTYFFNGNRSAALPGETWKEIPSYPGPSDEHPGMKALEIADCVVQALEEGGFDHLRLNIANGDMVGHTGSFKAAIEALEVMDEALGRIALAAEVLGAILLVTADHGNADEMYKLDKKSGRYATDAEGRPRPSSSHSLNPVPLILADPTGSWALKCTDHERPCGGLAQIGATVLELCGVRVPEDYLPSLVERRTLAGSRIEGRIDGRIGGRIGTTVGEA